MSPSIHCLSFTKRLSLSITTTHNPAATNGGSFPATSRLLQTGGCWQNWHHTTLPHDSLCGRVAEQSRPANRLRWCRLLITASRNLLTPSHATGRTEGLVKGLACQLESLELWKVGLPLDWKVSRLPSVHADGTLLAGRKPTLVPYVWLLRPAGTNRCRRT